MRSIISKIQLINIFSFILITAILSSCGKSSIHAVPFINTTSEANETISLSQSIVDFGSVGAGINKNDPIVIENNTNSAIQIGSVSITGADNSEFTIASDSCTSQTIPPGGQCTISIESNPSASPGQKSANVDISITSSSSNLEVPISMDISSSSPPTAASNASISAPSDTTTSITLNSATSVEGNPISYTLEQAPSHGQLVDCMNQSGSTGSDDLTCNYIPNSGFIGSDSFTYRANDGLDSNATTYSLNISSIAVISDYKSDTGEDFFIKDTLIDSAGNQYYLGVAPSNAPSYIIWKYDSNGNLDTSFSGDGKMSVSPVSGVLNAKGMIFDASENIYVYGHVTPSSFSYATIWKIDTSTGQLDTSFNGTGIWTTAINPSAIYDLIIDQNNKLVFTYHYYDFANFNLYFDKLNLDGTDDVGFSPVLIGATSSGSTYTYLVEDTSGNLYIRFNWTVYKYNSSGALDTSFGTSGHYKYTFLTTSNEYDMILHNDKLYIPGNDGYVYSINLDGTANTDFDSDGKILYQLNYTGFNANSKITYLKIIPDGNGNFYAVGYVSGTLHTSGFGHLIVSKFDTSGTLDTNFGESGHLFKIAGDSVQTNDDFNGGWSASYKSSDSTLYIGGRYNNYAMTWKLK
ncbi:MAG: choice-of-anchor D domain-containing protein [Halobacteriovoraceae bacterium]|nr:choice-of-anchor D domain-containing protein [Halobacteriovoraceae bacterium]